MNKAQHLKRHEGLMGSLDELCADMIAHTSMRPSQTTVLALMQWASKQATSPDHVAEGEDAAQQLAEADNAGLLRAAQETAEVIRADNAAFLAFDEKDDDWCCAALHRAVIRTCDDFLAALGIAA